MLNKKQLLSAAVGALTALSLAAGALAFADTAATTSTATIAQHMGAGVAGTVAAINGNSVTLTGKDGTTYTVDVGGAAITKEETVTAADIAVGDTLVANGTVNGTSVTATNVRDGKLPEGGFGGRGPGGPGFSRGVFGMVSAISGTTLTVTETNPKDSTTKTYTVDASSATVMIAPATAGTKPATGALSDVKVGDTVSVMGTTSGTTVTAKSIFDGQFPMPKWNGHKPASTGTSSGSTTQ